MNCKDLQNLIFCFEYFKEQLIVQNVMLIITIYSITSVFLNSDHVTDHFIVPNHSWYRNKRY